MIITPGSGNSIVDNYEARQRETPLHCPDCDCVHEHRCISCDHYIAEAECSRHEGYCAYCALPTIKEEIEQLNKDTNTIRQIRQQLSAELKDI